LEVSQLNTLESDVLDVIPSGSEHKIAIRDVSQLIGIDERTVYDVINSLRKKGVPVCAKRSGEDRGYFIAETEEERSEGLAAYKSQVKDMTQLINQIESADLEGWRASL
jgi:predicted transcriptional regulator